jgi:hypothetical protein
MSINNKIKEFFSSVIKLQSKKVVSKDNPYKYNKKSEVFFPGFLPVDFEGTLYNSIAFKICTQLMLEIRLLTNDFHESIESK